MNIAFVGAGRLAQTLATAFANAGFSVVAVADRSSEQAGMLARSAPGCRVSESAQAAASIAELAFITVPDDAIESVARQIRWRPGQFVVHCSGATEVAVLRSAAEQGAEIGGFHPLQLFADPQVALPLMAGSSVAIEAEGTLDAELRRLAAGVGYRPIKLPPGVRARYHAATNYAASFLLSMLREACDLWNSFGVNDADALAALLPLARGTLDTAAAKGLAGALAGPISRGDAAIVALHMRDLAQLESQFLEFYRSVSVRQLRLAKERGHLDSETSRAWKRLCQPKLHDPVRSASEVPLLPRRPRGDDGVQRISSVGQRGRPRLLHRRGLGLVQFTVADRGDRVPTAPTATRFGLAIDEEAQRRLEFGQTVAALARSARAQRRP